MATHETMAVLFDPKPEQFSLRGDDEAWPALKKRLANVAFPDNPNEANVVLRSGFDKVVGVELYARDCPDTVERPNWDHSGMSGGFVDLQFWRKTLMPLLEERIASHISR